jgi:hypothetical protein
VGFAQSGFDQADEVVELSHDWPSLVKNAALCNCL